MNKTYIVRHLEPNRVQSFDTLAEAEAEARAKAMKAPGTVYLVYVSKKAYQVDVSSPQELPVDP